MKDHPQERRLIDKHQAARMMSVSARTWDRLVSRGDAPAGIKLGNLRRWDAQDLAQWIASGCPQQQGVNHG